MRLILRQEPGTPPDRAGLRPRRAIMVLHPTTGGATRRHAALDRFDRVQLEDVARVCATAKSLSQAGRELFAVSRTQRASTNDADRLRKYLARFGLDWEQVREGGRAAPRD
ncbi:hypothetical protein [Xanthomonas sp. LMG 9002]|uniref:hypothetical protein n=1 Tax=Xanthomonas sp. LMG 9002 TaxID=1591158 RepID=UPI002729AC7F|nr:hypothetical protein [Xanthomonas sp. LMG 9002]